MVLYGKTDRETVAESAPKVDVRAYVGTKKKPGKSGNLIFGDDLITHFRLETDNKAIANSLRKLGVDNNGLIEELEIILAYNQVEKAFNSKAQKWSQKGDKLSGLLWECNRREIYKRKEEYETKFGDVRSRFIKCNEPCPVAGTQEKCPLGCGDTGTLYFYMPGLLDFGHNALCSLVLSGEFNIRETTAKLYEIEEQFGTIKDVQGSPSTYNAVLFKLGRYTANRPHPIIHNKKRTGKTKLVPTHLISLQIDHHWLSFYQNMQQMNQVRALGYKPDIKMIQQIYGEVVIEQTSQLPGQQEAIALPPSWKLSRADAQELKNLRIKEGWSEYAYEEMLFDYFQISDRKDILNINQQQFNQIKSNLRSSNFKDAFKVNSELDEF